MSSEGGCGRQGRLEEGRFAGGRSRGFLFGYVESQMRIMEGSWKKLHSIRIELKRMYGLITWEVQGQILQPWLDLEMQKKSQGLTLPISHLATAFL